MNYTTIEHCRLCYGTVRRVLDFGEVPLANAYPTSPHQPEDLYPLSVAKCVNCGHVQLEQTVDPEILFKNYLYSSSDSPALVAHLRGLAIAARQFLPNRDDKILEIGCNDGVLLSLFSGLGYCNLYGIDPAKNLASKSQETGAKIFPEFFSHDLALEILALHGPMKLIVATNTFAHVAKIADLTTGIRTLLAPGGVFIFENAYLLKTIEDLYFDQFYHEHLQYYAMRPLVVFLERLRLELFDVQPLATQGGSFRAFVKLLGDDTHSISSNVAEWIRREVNNLLYDDSVYEFFSRKLMTAGVRFSDFLDREKRNGKTISCYGCPAKFTLLSQVFGLRPPLVDYVVDDSPLKQGRFSPGAKIPIVSNAHFQEHPTDVCVITAWNMADAIKDRNPHYKGRWVTPFAF